MQESGEAYVAQTFIMEQYLDGPEVDVDIVVSQVSDRPLGLLAGGVSRLCHGSTQPHC